MKKPAYKPLKKFRSNTNIYVLLSNHCHGERRSSTFKIVTCDLFYRVISLTKIMFDVNEYMLISY